MARKQVTLSMPVVVRYDDARTTPADAVTDFYRALEEAEQAGHFERINIDFTYGMGEPSEPTDSTDSMDVEEMLDLIEAHDAGEHTTSWDDCPVCEQRDDLAQLREYLGLVETST